MPILEVRQLRKTFGDLVAVADVSFAVEAGDVFGLLGPNGAGKSTTMMMICGLLKADSGDVLLNGQKMQPGRHELKRLLGVVPQELAIYPELTARENLQFFSRLYGLSGARLKSRVDDALERTGLTNRADDVARNFSGGMKRRLNFGCALVHEPEILILDEPTVGVDPQSRSHLLDSVQQLAGDGVTIIYSSHYMEEVQEVCRRIAIIDHGQVIAVDAIDTLLSRLSSVIRLRINGTNVAIPERYAVVATAERTGHDEWTIEIDRGKLDAGTTLNETLATLFKDLRSDGATLDSIETHEPNLERLFLQLTGGSLRD